MKQLWLYVIFSGVVILLGGLIFILRLYRGQQTIQNFEEQEYGLVRPFLEPHSVQNGLAVYSAGEGAPVLLFPYPHAATKAPMAQEPLAQILIGMGRRVVTFDVPGAYRSTREPVGDMQEMITGATETLERLGIEGPVDVIGHSMGGLSALAFAIEHPEHTNKLVLIGTFSGFPAAAKWGMPGSLWRMTDGDYWRLIVWGLQVKLGTGSLATHKQLQNLMEGASYYDKTFFKPLKIEADDHKKGVPVREVLWGKNMLRKLSYADRLGKVQAPTLVIAGRHDPEGPLPCSQELHNGIPASSLVVFEKSGHFPFIEEVQKFTNSLDAFLNSPVGT